MNKYLILNYYIFTNISSMTNIIYISGLSGSGKTTLGNKLKLIEDIKVFDLDDIDDTNALELLQKPWMGITNFNKLKDKMNKLKITQIIKTFKHNYIYVFVGLLDEINKFATHKFFIKPDIITIYKQVNLRTLTDIVNSENEIKELLNNCKTIVDMEKTNEILLYKYKIRRLFPDSKDGIQFMIKKRTIDAKKYKFKILTADKIYESVIKINNKFIHY